MKSWKTSLCAALVSAGAAAGHINPAWDPIGKLLLAIGTALGLFFAADHSAMVQGDVTAPAAPISGGVNRIGLWFLIAFLPLAGLAGCHSTSNRIAYNTVSTTATAVSAAVQGWKDYGAQFPDKVTPAQDAQVRAAYVKYQAAMSVVADGYHMFGFNGTNAPPAFQEMESAAIAAGTDLVNLVALFKK